MIRLADAYDRPEVLQVLDLLRENGFIQSTIEEELLDGGLPSDGFLIGTTTPLQSRGVYWSPTASSGHLWWHV